MSGAITKGQQEILELLAKRSGRSIDDVTELWNERVAIREFEGGKKRKEAERDAIDDVANVMLGGTRS